MRWSDIRNMRMLLLIVEQSVIRSPAVPTGDPFLFHVSARVGCCFCFFFFKRFFVLFLVGPLFSSFFRNQRRRSASMVIAARNYVARASFLVLVTLVFCVFSI